MVLFTIENRVRVRVRDRLGLRDRKLAGR